MSSHSLFDERIPRIAMSKKLSTKQPLVENTFIYICMHVFIYILYLYIYIYTIIYTCIYLYADICPIRNMGPQNKLSWESSTPHNSVILRRLKKREWSHDARWHTFTPFTHLQLHVDVSKNRVFPPKWMVYFMKNPIKMDDLGVSLFLETSIFDSFPAQQVHVTQHPSISSPKSSIDLFTRRRPGPPVLKLDTW